MLRISEGVEEGVLSCILFCRTVLIIIYVQSLQNVMECDVEPSQDFSDDDHSGTWTSESEQGGRCTLFCCFCGLKSFWGGGE